MSILRDLFNKGMKKAIAPIKKMIIVFLIKLVAIIVIPILVVMTLASFWYILKEKIVSDVSETVRENTGTNKTVQANASNRSYTMDEEFVKKVEEKLEAMQISKTSIGLDSNLDLIKNLYKAEVMTSFPDLRKREKIGSEIAEDEIQGAIQFLRRYSDGTEELLEYMDFNKFREEVAKFGYKLPDSEGNILEGEAIYKEKSDVDEKYKNLRSYFTLDEENNLLVATIDSTESETKYSDYAKEEENKDSSDYSYNLNVQKINYQNLVSKYSMPLEFTLTMLMVTENQGFCEAIVSLIEDTKIVIEVQDNLTVITKNDKYDYKSVFSFNKEVKYDIDVEIEDETHTSDSGAEHRRRGK